MPPRPCYRLNHRADSVHLHTWRPPITPELIGILAVGATLIGLLITFRRDARAEMASFRAEMRADMQNFRTEVRGEISALRKDVQALTKRVARLEGRMSHLEGRMSRLEGVIEGFFAGRGPRTRHDDAA